jgi:tRNA(Arg) A34 adenosine deaminase TadA
MEGMPVKTNMEPDEHAIMREALQEAEAALQRGDRSIVAVIVRWSFYAR